ncbi:putative Dol-P-Man:Man(5)GlcNAc(2)-PP-Dol alpha-1,3-mannosyltransferase [Porphyridium purpureum]|uniref:dolichyl-P-Man:Man5GlcNAc2-PP-dolichol alpha-1,3-mannosyltransferase n=1 Tax=Porphyridium purpureum TaxID=35688 RepID=A0A5J4Z5X8_PORPP|nr:putative Dol-P-Man:Man(5)GlcNAc(2)-PP-Dol alpha-1,3-mannosyltransferase [Porphyridium purpureum]|eukprot:POR7337..scf295_1
MGVTAEHVGARIMCSKANERGRTQGGGFACASWTRMIGEVWLDRLDRYTKRRDGFMILSAFVLLFVAVSGSFVIVRVPYTEIDWVAYMQEVAGVLEGERDYIKLRGDTGPLVYPAGFVYIYSFLFYVTDAGVNVQLAQWIFLAVLLCTVAVVLGFYRVAITSQPGLMPPLVVMLLVASRRVMSLHVLRLFNDCVEALLAYASILLFAHNKWAFGCVLYSLAVSVKMNALLYAPALLMLLLQANGVARTIGYLSICAVVQIVLGLPFLISHPVQYLTKAFELSRVFEHRWSVNYAFLSIPTFTSKGLALVLLLGHLATLAWFGSREVWGRKVHPVRSTGRAAALDADYVLRVLFTCNLIGIAFARTLHYQFYAWYFHTLPYLLWRGRLPFALKLAVLLGIEMAYNIYPPRAWSSIVLHVCHAITIAALSATSSVSKSETSKHNH